MNGDIKNSWNLEFKRNGYYTTSFKGFWNNFAMGILAQLKNIGWTSFDQESYNGLIFCFGILKE